MAITNMHFCRIVLLVLVLSSPVRSSEPETFRIGVCMSLTGDFSSSGRAFLAGVHIAAEDFNRRSAATGVRVELLVRDDASDSARGAAMLRELAAEGVVAVVGSNSTDVTLAMLNDARKLNLPLITPGSTSRRIGGKGDVAFRVLFDNAFQGYALAEFMRETLGFRRAAVLVNRRFAYTRDLAESFVATWTGAGGTIVREEAYDLGVESAEDHDFRPSLERLKAAKPELVLLSGYPDVIIAVLNQSLDIGFDPIFCGGDTWQNDSLIYAAGNHLAGNYHIGYLDEDSDTPEMFTFMELLDNSNDLAAGPISVLGYDAMGLILTALLRGGRTREGIIEQLYSVRNLPLASGDITIDREAGTKKSAYIMKFESTPKGFRRRVVDTITP